MKKFILISALFSSSFAFAIQRNPQIRTCNNLGGDFVVASSHDDQIGFCQFGKALIGSLDLDLYLNNGVTPQSIDAYKNKQTDCGSAGGNEATLAILGTNDSLQVCSFGDNSFVELNTLTKGADASDNAKLSQALGL